MLNRDKCKKGHTIEILENEQVGEEICWYCERKGSKVKFGCFNCSKCQKNLCWTCLYQCYVKVYNMPMEDLFACEVSVPFSKTSFTNYNFRMYKYKKWVCASELLKGHHTIPREWAHCESGLTKELTDDQYEALNLNRVEMYVSQSNLKLCFKCVIKWSKFPKEAGKDYLLVQ